ncbi:hypothetical protein [Rummeliibacillus pycnus]|uniref:hypothetical protein n=1 Tax=Rummeliibacillus pycnus TaxID=101070 RepID=UPI0037C52D62
MKRRSIFIIGLILFAVSALPLFYMVREVLTKWMIDSQYSINHAYKDDQGFSTIIDAQNIEVNGLNIRIVEEPTGKKGSLTPWDKEEGVEAGDIVKLHLFVEGKEVTPANEIWLSNRKRGSRYFSWLDILTVNKKIAIVQRLTDDDTPMEDRRWKIIWIEKNGKITEEHISYKQRGENPIAVRLINASGTDRMMMGYYSDILTFYPTIFFPFMYPIGTGIAGFVICLIFLIQRRKQKTTNN